MAVLCAVLLVALGVPVLSACGSASADPAPAPVAEAAPVGAQPVAPVPPGGVVTQSPDMPKNVARILRGDAVVVVAFLLPRAVDDRVVERAIADVRALPAFRSGVRYFVYNVTARSEFGDLADHLGAEGTPAVAVIGRDRVLANLWNAPIDAQMLRQAITDASARTSPSSPATSTVSPTP